MDNEMLIYLGQILAAQNSGSSSDSGSGGDVSSK